MEVDQQHEAAPLRLQGSPLLPTQAMIDEHEAQGHAVFRSWCAHCKESWGLSRRHEVVDHSKDELPTVCSDFYYMMDEPKEGENKPLPPPFLALYDRRTKCVAATSLKTKASTFGPNVRFFSRFLEGLGYPRFVNKSDVEAAMVALKKNAAQYAKLEAVPEESPVGDHQANGEIENVVMQVKRRQRAIRSSLEAKLGFALEDSDPVLAWAPTFAANQMNRFRVLEDGRTPDQRRTGKTWKKHGLLFGEQVLFKQAGTPGRKNDYEKRMNYGRYVGHHNRHGSILCLTPDGLKVGSSYSRLAEGTGMHQKWQTDGWKQLKGLPWDVLPRVRQGHAAVTEAGAEVAAEVATGGESAEVAPRVPTIPQTVAAEQKRRGTFPVQRRYVEKYGYTPLVLRKRQRHRWTLSFPKRLRTRS